MDDEAANIWVASSDGDMARVKELLSEGVDVNAQDEAGYSALHGAVSYSHLVLVKYLLDHGADVHIRDEDGDTPLLVCETTEVFDALVEAGADPTKANFIGETLQQKLMEEHNHELLSHLMNYALRKGLGDSAGITVTTYSREEEDESR